MRYKFVTIEREYGSGGRLIAAQVAKECDIECYGQEILEIVAKENDITVERIQKYEESMSGSFLYSIYMMSKQQRGEQNLASIEGALHIEQQKVIKRLAGKGRAVFIGHCAGEALDNRNDVLKVFIKADKAKRRKRCIEQYEIPENKVDSIMKRYDKKRSHYFQENTKQRWDSEESYDIVLDSGKIGIKGCVAVLKGLLEL